MQPGDFVIAPAMDWHDRRERPMAVVCAGQTPEHSIIRFFDASTRRRQRGAATDCSPRGQILARYGAMLPVRYDAPHGSTSPIFSCPMRAAVCLPACSATVRGRARRLQVALREPGHWWIADADDGDFSLQLLPRGFSKPIAS